MAKSIPTWTFVLVVVQEQDPATQTERFLVVREQKHGQNWYLPAGGVDRGESLLDAAKRETLEEAGIDIELTGVLRVEHTPVVDGARFRLIFTARTVGDSTPKTHADKESLEARWCTLDEVAELPLRGREVLDIFEYVSRGGAVFPLDILANEAQIWSAA